MDDGPAANEESPSAWRQQHHKGQGGPQLVPAGERIACNGDGGEKGGCRCPRGAAVLRRPMCLDPSGPVVPGVVGESPLTERWLALIVSVSQQEACMRLASGGLSLPSPSCGTTMEQEEGDGPWSVGEDTGAAHGEKWALEKRASGEVVAAGRIRSFDSWPVAGPLSSVLSAGLLVEKTVT
ncbi:hypothetical protein CSOJ01_14681 [Colletotrichum sojae]|uniref:Uncharacterized protein n=1 Tax=Colletotrichum sojae TaxID=2175907 RepID=A0A8H6IQ30_9PEZI|nr:hypothetical protein CSOJ01_14681 [Colletotrichum sojae]